MVITSGSTTAMMAFYLENEWREPITGITDFVVYRSRNGSTPVEMVSPTITEAGVNAPGLYHLLINEDTTLSSGSINEELLIYITAEGIPTVVRSVDIQRSYAIVDAIYDLFANTRSEPGGGAPGVDILALTKLDYLYKWARNKKNANGTVNQYYADDGSTVDHVQGTSESAGIVTVGEMAGP